MQQEMNPIIVAFLQARQLAQQQAESIMEEERKKEELKVEKDRLKEQQRQFNEEQKRLQKHEEARMRLNEAIFKFDVAKTAREEFAKGTRRLQGMTGLPISVPKQGPAFEDIIQNIPREFTPFESQRIETPLGPELFPTEEIATPETIQEQVLRLRQKALPTLAAESYAKAGPQIDIARANIISRDILEDKRIKARIDAALISAAARRYAADQSRLRGQAGEVEDMQHTLEGVTSGIVDIKTIPIKRRIPLIEAAGQRGDVIFNPKDKQEFFGFADGIQQFISTYKDFAEKHKDFFPTTQPGRIAKRIGTISGTLSEFRRDANVIEGMIGNPYRAFSGESAKRISDLDRKFAALAFMPRADLDYNEITNRINLLEQFLYKRIRTFAKLKNLSPKQIKDLYDDLGIVEPQENKPPALDRYGNPVR